MNFRREHWNELWGVHSNIPRCCILYFNEDAPRTAHTVSADWRTIDGKVANYRLCPRCRVESRIYKIHDCDSSNPGCEAFFREVACDLYPGREAECFFEELMYSFDSIWRDENRELINALHESMKVKELTRQEMEDQLMTLWLKERNREL